MTDVKEVAHILRDTWDVGHDGRITLMELEQLAKVLNASEEEADGATCDALDLLESEEVIVEIGGDYYLKAVRDDYEEEEREAEREALEELLALERVVEYEYRVSR